MNLKKLVWHDPLGGQILIPLVKSRGFQTTARGRNPARQCLESDPRQLTVNWVLFTC